ncbi:MAG: oligosaccharide flippase family protein [Methanomethylovorans sp.]|nr:oligosaccharide flippase family protein [Methanomethylovorans sp.]
MVLKVHNASRLVQHLHDPLFNNSISIMLTSFLSAGFGFVFWVLAAKLYSAEDVGTATAMISSMGFIIMLSRLGLDASMIRFFPDNDKKRIFSTSLIVATCCALLFGTIFILSVDLLAPELYLLKSPANAALYLIFLAANSGTALSCISFVAVRKASFQLVQSIIVSSRILFLIPLVALGAMGIFCSLGISLLIAIITAYVLLAGSGVRPGFVADWKFLDKAFHYAAGNYIAGLFMAGPGLILPIMVLNMLGSKQAAYYFIAYAIATLLFKIPNAVSTSLFVEGSHGERMKKNAAKSLLFTYLLLIPASGIMYLCSHWILEAISAEYAAEGVILLQVMIVSGLFTGLNFTYFAVQRVRKDIKELIVLSGSMALVVVGAAYVLMPIFGIVGAGYAWLAGNVTGNMLVALMVWVRNSTD